MNRQPLLSAFREQKRPRFGSSRRSCPAFTVCARTAFASCTLVHALKCEIPMFPHGDGSFSTTIMRFLDITYLVYAGKMCNHVARTAEPRQGKNTSDQQSRTSPLSSHIFVNLLPHGHLNPSPYALYLISHRPALHRSCS